jgi:hypothetical protein
MKNLNELKEMKNRLSEIINRHEKLAHAYFWTPSGNASGRRSSENRNNDVYENEHYNIHAKNDYRESCKNVYYHGRFSVDGKTTTALKIKNIVAALDAIC